jgi:hypothetical protein
MGVSEGIIVLTILTGNVTRERSANSLTQSGGIIFRRIDE